MAPIPIMYGRREISIEIDTERFRILRSVGSERPLSDAEIGERLDTPIASGSLEEIVSPGQSVLIAVPDATRQTACGQVVNLLVRRLISNGSGAADISIIFSTGIHRRVSEAEKSDILTPFIAQRIKTLDHDAYDGIRNFRVGETSAGIPVEVDWRLTEFDHVIIVGGVSFHYFAGFTGGRKLICPGLASAKTIAATHKLAFDCERNSRSQNVAPGVLDGNPVHEAFMEAVSFISPAFSVNNIVSETGELIDVFCGDWQAAHRTACDAYAAAHTIRISEKRELVIASCGGYPFDINMIQAHKALDAASQACIEGGTIILFAECAEGLGRDDFLDWFEAEDSTHLARSLCENYQVNGQTAWSLLTKCEKFDVRLVSELAPSIVQKMRMKPTSKSDVDDLIRDKKKEGYILPFGAKNIIET
jgi:nickel-dependent lactate racemase